MSSGLGNGHATVRSRKLARAMRCGSEVGGRARRGASGSYSWPTRGPLSSQLLDSGRETREELCEEERTARRMSGCRCLAVCAVKERCGARSKARPRETGNSLPRTSGRKLSCLRDII
jgi:hypothetical protein